MTRTVLVTGAAGFVGSHLLARLRSIGDVQITGFGRRQPCFGPWDSFVRGDMTRREEVQRLVGDTRPDEIYHLAGVARGTDAELEAVNLVGTSYLLEAVASLRPGAALIVMGSAAEYGRTAASGRALTEEDRCEPVNAYGRSKHAATLATLAAAEAGIRANVVRPFNLVGAGIPESLVIGAVVSRLRAMANGRERSLRLGSIHSQRDFLDVGDAVDAMVTLARSGLAGRVFNLCTGIPCSIAALVEKLCLITEMDVTIVQDPALFAPEDAPFSVGSPAAATAALGFRSTTALEVSLRAAWAGRHPGPVPV